LSNYSTISVPGDVKKTLEEAKGNKDWGSYLLELYAEADKAKRNNAFQKLADILTDDDLESIEDSSKEFREKLKIG
jgi:predicted CopG family antitoxin